MPIHRQSCAVALVGLVFLLSAGLWGCGETQAARLSSGIALENETGGALDALDFGEVPLNGQVERKFVIRSVGPVPLDVSAIEIGSADGESAMAFTPVPAGPTSIRPRDTLTVLVRFQPREVRRYPATLIVKSDDPDHPEMKVELVGDGVAGRLEVFACLPNTDDLKRRCADTQVSPPDALSLGDVTEGAHAAARVTLQNGGGDTLTVSSVAFADPAAAAAAGFTFPTGPEGPGGVSVIGSLESGSFKVDFNPPVGTAGPASTTIVIESNSITDPRVELVIEAQVVPNTAPQACLYVREIRHADGTTETFDPGDELPVVEPTDVVTLDAAVREGCTGDAEDGTDVTLAYTVTAPGANAQVDRVPAEPLVATLEAEAIGTYTVELLVTDKLGLTATTDAAGTPAVVTFEVAPRRDIAVEIGWRDDPFVDVDLHFVRGDGAVMFSAEDTYWKARTRDWGTRNDPFDDPLLLLDDTGTGALVETVVLNRPEAGQSYWVFARLTRDDRGRSTAPPCTKDDDCSGDLACSMITATSGVCLSPVDLTLKVFLRSVEFDVAGLPGFEAPAQLKSLCDAWLAGRVIWPASKNGTPTFEPANLFPPPEGVPQGAVCSVQ